MIKRKALVQEKQEKIKEVRKKKIKIDLNDLPDAISEGKLLVPVGGKVLFERGLDGKTRTHMGEIKSVEESGIVQIWDETRENWFMFSLKEKLPIIKIYKLV